jgi:hypothetical protein
MAGNSSSGSAPTSSTRVAAIAVATLLVSCLPAVRRGQPLDPKSAASGTLERLAVQRSFAFELSYHTDFPFPIAVSFSGVRESTDREQWSGSWRRRGEVSRVDLRGDGPDQFERAGFGWRKAMRGAETRILDHARGAFGAGAPAFVETRAGRYVYRFEPVLPTLDPTGRKQLRGVLEVDAYSGLPLRIHGADSAGTAGWELRLSRFNSARRVDVPFIPAMTVAAKPGRGSGKAKVSQSAAIIRRRLDALGWEFRLSGSGAGFELQLGKARTPAQARLLLDSGRVEVWESRWPVTGADSSQSLPVGGDAARIVLLDRLLAANGTLGVRVEATSPVETGLEVVSGVPVGAALYTLLLDGRAVSAAARSDRGRLVFYDLGSGDEVRIIAVLAGSAVLPARFEVTVRP